MRTFLCLFLCSLLLTTGVSLECETCIADDQYCSGRWLTCGHDQDTCATVVTEATFGGFTFYSIIKGCNTKAICNMDENYNLLGTDVVAKVECSKAVVPSGSLLLSLLGLLLMKMLL